jgi:divalent metal cation (Fe/Co/Zn/Cd) transporter
LLREFEEAYMKDLLRFDHLSTRRAGQCAFADFHMHVPSSWRLGQAASVRAEVEKALRGQWPELRTNIQMLPFDVEPLSLLSWDTRS